MRDVRIVTPQVRAALRGVRATAVELRAILEGEVVARVISDSLLEVVLNQRQKILVVFQIQ